MLRYFRLLFLLAVGSVAVGSAGAQQPVSATVLQPQAHGSTSWSGVEAQFVLVRTDTPGGTAKAGGSSLVVVPPVSFPKTDSGEPDVSVRDPKRFCDGLWVTAEGHPKLLRTAKDVAEAVQAGELPPETAVDIAFTLTLHDDLSLRLAVYESFHAQQHSLDQPVKTPAPPTAAPAPAPASTAGPTVEEMRRAVQSVSLLPARTLRLRFESPGLEALVVEVGNGSNLGRRLGIETRSTAGFLARLHTKGGVSMRLDFVFDAYGVSHSTATARDIVSSFVKVLLSAKGDGETAADSRDGGGAVRILTTRDAVNRVSEALKASRDIVIEGSSAEDINFLTTLLQQGLVNVPGVAADKMAEFVKENFDTKKVLEAPGVVTAFQRMGEKKTLTDEETDRFYSDFASHARKAQGGGGFSLGPIGFGGGGGSESQDTTARKEQRRDAVRKFAHDLYEYKTSGSFPVHPKLSYNIVSSQDLEQQCEQHLKLRRAQKVSERVLSTRFNSATPTLEESQLDLNIRLREVLDRMAAKPMAIAPPAMPPKK